MEEAAQGRPAEDNGWRKPPFVVAEYEYAALDLDEPFHQLPCKGSADSLDLKGDVEPDYEPRQ